MNLFDGIKNVFKSDEGIDDKLLEENNKTAKYKYEVVSISDSAYVCSIGARTCYGLNADKEYIKNRKYIGKILGFGHDSVSAHSNIMVLIKAISNDSLGGDPLLNVLPALKFMNIAVLTDKYEDEETSEKFNTKYILLSGSVRAYRYFVMTYPMYNDEDSDSSFYNVIMNVIYSSIESEFFSDLIEKGLVDKDKFTYVAPIMPPKISDDSDEDLSIDDKTAESIHYPELDGERVDIIYSDEILSIYNYLTSELPHVDKDKIIKAIFDTSIITIRLHNYSRAISQQINRHMSGISQESQRYVDYSSAQFIDPLVFDTEKYDVGKLYDVELFGTKVKITSQELGDSLVKIYNQLKNQGMLSQDARSFLPINVKTKTIHTFTYTNFLHFIKVRTKPQTQAENRCIANEMKDLMLRSLYESVSIEYGKDEEVNKSIDKMKDVYKLFESKILELTK